MEKMLYFAKLLSEALRKEYEVFYDIGYKLLSFSEDYSKYGGTKLLLKGNQYIILEELYEDMETDELMWEVHEDEGRLTDYATDYDEGLIFPNDFLYEVLYDFGMLGDEFGDKEKDSAVKRLLRTIYKIAGAFNLELAFQDGRIYIREDKKPLDDGSFICRTMSEIEVLCELREGAGLMEAREVSGMSEGEFKSFMERLKQHEWKQTSACEE